MSFFSVVSPSGTVMVTPLETRTTINSTVNLTCSAGGGPNNMFEWRRQGVIISGDPLLSITVVTSSDGGVYQCTVTNDAGTDSFTATVISKHDDR